MTWTVTYIIPNAPVSLLLADLYRAGEPLDPIGVLGNSPIGVSGTVATSVSNLYFNVLAYGAKADGVTDDTAAVQSAVNAAAVGGGTVFFPATCGITAPISVTTDNVGFLGVGGLSGLKTLAGFVGAAMIVCSGSSTRRFSCSNMAFSGPSGTYSSNPAADGIQFQTDSTDNHLTDLEFRALNGWAINFQTPPGSSMGYAVISNCVSRAGKAGFQFHSTTPATARSGGIVLTNCVADNCQNGEAYLFDETTDNVLSNCQGYSQTSASIHIKGCSFLYIENFDTGGASPSASCVVIEAGATHTNDHITLETVMLQKGVTGLLASAVTHLRVINCDVFFNQTHGIQVNDAVSNGMMEFIGCQFFQNNTTHAVTAYDIENVDTHGQVLFLGCEFDNNGATTLTACVDSTATGVIVAPIFNVSYPHYSGGNAAKLFDLANANLDGNGALTIRNGQVVPTLRSAGGGASGISIWVGTTDPAGAAGEGDVWLPI